MRYFKKKCTLCNSIFEPLSGNQVYCGSIDYKAGCSYKAYIVRQSKKSLAKWRKNQSIWVSNRKPKTCIKCGRPVVDRTYYHRVCLDCVPIRIKKIRETKIRNPLRSRYLILKRDSFTCQYCGRKAPDVILEIDHIVPKSKGGQNILDNLLTSCKDCNLGKGDYLL